MNWLAYQLLFRLDTPLHIGWRRVGNCWQCRPYLPAYPLLCALAARLAESGLLFDNNARDPYYNTLTWLREHVRLTYFFPALLVKENNGRQKIAVFLPRCQNDGSVAYLRQKQDLGGGQAGQDTQSRCPAAEFDYLFMDAQARTALSYPKRSALEGALYHFEFLRPHTRTHSWNDHSYVSKPVYLTGYVLFDEEALKELLGGEPDSGNKRFEFLFDRLQVGGERRLGWGLLRLADKREVKSGAALFGLAGTELDLAGDAKVKVEDVVPVLAHLVRSQQNGPELTGPVEVMLRRETRFKEGKQERRLSGTSIVLYGPAGRQPLFFPGSMVKEQSKFPITFSITEEGLWLLN